MNVDEMKNKATEVLAKNKETLTKVKNVAITGGLLAIGSAIPVLVKLGTQFVQSKLGGNQEEE